MRTSAGEARMIRPAPGAALFLLAHHDDEVFCAGALAEVLTAGRRVKLLWATAGGLAPARRRLAEGRRVQRLLGLPDLDARPLGLPDQHAVERIGEVKVAAAAMMDGVDEVYATAWEGGHPDHDAMNLVAAQLRADLVEPGASGASGAVRFFEFGLYRRGRGGLAVKSPYGPDEPPLNAGALALRRALARADISQWPSLRVLATAARLQRTWATEPLRELPADRDYALPPAPDPLLYSLYTRWDFARFRRAAGY